MKIYLDRPPSPWRELLFLLAALCSWTPQSTLASEGSLLQINPLSESSVELVWPATGPDYDLQETGDLQGGEWTLITEGIVEETGVKRVTLERDLNNRFFRLRGFPPPLSQLSSTSPIDGSSSVAVTRETILRFSQPLSTNSELDPNAVVARFGESELATRLQLSSDGKTITAFYNDILPAGTRVEVRVDGDLLEDTFGKAIDVDNDGQPGGVKTIEFKTLNIATLPGTAVVGQVLASELGEENGQPINVPLEGVRITLDGREDEIFTVTDAEGNFKLEPVPGGEFFVHIDGREAVGSQYPNGDYYPFVGKSWVSVPGYDNTLAGKTGIVHLPLVKAGTLQPVSDTEETEIAFLPEVVQAFPELDGVSITVPANSLFSDNGVRGGSVGIAPVPPDRLPGQLPEMLQFPLVITVQTNGPQNFDVPAPARFPNLPDPVTGETLPPGAKTALWSFNHDSGRWELQGPMTISEDGLYAVSDPGVGIQAPGWHGVNPGGEGDEGGGGPNDKDDDNDDDDNPDDPPPPGDPCEKELQKAFSAGAQCAGSFVTAIPFFGCGSSIATGVAAAGADCAIDFNTCDRSVITQTAGTLIGCIPVYGGVASIAYNCLYGGGTALSDYYLCDGPFSSEDGDSIVTLSRQPDGHRVLPLADLPSNPLEAQAELWAAAAGFYEIVYGDEAWTYMDPEEWPVAEAFFNSLHAFADEASEEGVGLSEAEKVELADLPRPSNISEEILAATIDRIDRLNRNQLTAEELDEEALRFALVNLVDALMQIESRGWETTWSGLLDTLNELSDDQDAVFGGLGSAFGEDGTPVSVNADPPNFSLQPNIHFKATNLSTGFVQRGRLGSNGEFDGLFLSPNTYYKIEYADTEYGRYGITLFLSRGPGLRTNIPRSLLVFDESDDSDSDGLPNNIENVIGTAIDNPDTDDDGVPDGAEVIDGTNPLDGLPLVAGIISSVDTPGKSVELAVVGDLAVLTNEVEGISLIDVSNLFEPVLINQFKLPSTVKFVTGAFNRLLVGTSDNNIHFIDISDPLNPIVQKSLAPGGWVQKVDAQGRYGYVGFSNSKIEKYDLIAGELVWQWQTDNWVEDISLSEGNIHVLTRSSLQIVSDSLTEPSFLGSVPVAGAASPLEVGRKLFVAEDHAYVGYFTGYSVIDISDPTMPMIVGEPSDTQLAVHDLALDGSGRLLATTSNAGENTLELTVYDASDPTIVDAAVANFETPGYPRAVVIHRGMALVADSFEGLQIVNYVGADSGNTPPAVSFAGGSAFDLDMLQAESSQLTWLAVDASDDVQIRSVDLLVNGVPVTLDGSYPFEINFRVPALTDEVDSFTIQAIATDTGGNVTATELLEFQLIDTIAPIVVVASPSENTPTFANELSVARAIFSEVINPATLTADSFKVVEIGEDGVLDTEDDVVISGERSFDPNTLIASLDTAEPFLKGDYRIVVTTQVSDFTGNSVETDTIFAFQIWDTNRWISGAASGSWLSAANWSEGNVRLNDRLIIDNPDVDAVTTISNQNYQIDSLLSEESLALQGRVLEIANEAIINGRFHLIGQSTLTGLGTSYANGGMEISGSSNKWVRGGHRFVNGGPVEWTDGNIIVSDLGSVFENAAGGTIEWLNDTGFITMGSNSAGEIVNDGTMIKRGDGLVQIQNTKLVNNGTIDIENGEFSFQILRHEGMGEYIVRENGILAFNYSQGVKSVIEGPVTLHEGSNINMAFGWAEIAETSSIIGPGTVTASRSETGLIGASTLEVYGLYDVANTIVDGGSQAYFHIPAKSGSLVLSGNGATLGGSGDIDISGDFTWTGGSIEDGGVVRVHGTLLIDQPGSIEMRNQTLEIYGDAICNPSNISPELTIRGPEYGRIEIMAGATWTMNDDFVISSTGAFSESFVFLNNGTFIKTGDLVSGLRMPFENRGLVVLEAGSLRIDTNYIQKAGETRFAGGSFSRGNFVPAPLFEGGLVTGFGTIGLGVSDVENVGATFDPGTADLAGAITIDGGFSQSAEAKIVIDIFGAAQTEGNWDQIIVDRFFTLDGALEVRLADGFVPEIGEVYPALVGENNRSGEFATVEGLEISADRKFEIGYTENGVEIRVVAIP